MEVLILSKTHFGNNVCVGGMELSSNKYVRLLYPPKPWYPFADTPFNIGDIWDIKFIDSSIVVPHVEDVLVQSQNFLRKTPNIQKLIYESNAPIWKGCINNIFDGTLLWTGSGSGYLSEKINNYPSHSVGFWKSDKPLTMDNDEHYVYPTGNYSQKRKFKYKGIPKALDVIPADTLLRVSLAKWWKASDSDLEKRCYLQLSGWYD